jgi:hypothetical protein
MLTRKKKGGRRVEQKKICKQKVSLDRCIISVCVCVVVVVVPVKKKKKNNFGEKKATLSRPYFLFSFAPLVQLNFLIIFFSPLSLASPFHCVFSILYFIGQTKTC